MIHSKRGGNVAARSHAEWLLTLPAKPDAIGFRLVPLTSLLRGVPGLGFLSHAINLYLRCMTSTHIYIICNVIKVPNYANTAL